MTSVGRVFKFWSGINLGMHLGMGYPDRRVLVHQKTSWYPTSVDFSFPLHGQSCILQILWTTLVKQASHIANMCKVLKFRVKNLKVKSLVFNEVVSQ
jgi:uncharacterized membrane protein